MDVELIKLSEKAKIPKYARDGDAGMDLVSTENVILNPNEPTVVHTGIAIAVPRGYEAQVRPRSGLAAKHGLTVLNSPGTIDSGYRGEICVIMINHGKTHYVVHEGERIAQMVISKYEEVQFQLVEKLDDTERGPDGLGSTGGKDKK